MTLSNLRRLYHHLVNGGTLNGRDYDRVNTIILDNKMGIFFNGSKEDLSKVISILEGKQNGNHCF